MVVYVQMEQKGLNASAPLDTMESFAAKVSEYFPCQLLTFFFNLTNDNDSFPKEVGLIVILMVLLQLIYVYTTLAKMVVIAHFKSIMIMSLDLDINVNAHLDTMETIVRQVHIE